jgi:hypothetical protein
MSFSQIGVHGTEITLLLWNGKPEGTVRIYMQLSSTCNSFPGGRMLQKGRSWDKQYDICMRVETEGIALKGCILLEYIINIIVFQLPPNNFQQELAHISCFSFFHVKTT